MKKINILFLKTVSVFICICFINFIFSEYTIAQPNENVSVEKFLIISDTTNNNKMNAGDTVIVKFYLKAISGNWLKTKAIVKCDDSYIDMEKGKILSFPTIYQGNEKISNESLTIKTSYQTPPNHHAKFDIIVMDENKVTGGNFIKYERAFSVNINVIDQLNAPILVDPGYSVDSGQSFKLTWNSVSGATSYIIEQAENRNFSNPTTYVVNNDNYKNLSYTTNSTTTLYFRVRAKNNDITSSWSEIVDITVNKVTREYVSGGSSSSASVGSSKSSDNSGFWTAIIILVVIYLVVENNKKKKKED